MKVGRALISSSDEELVESRIFFRAAGGKRLDANGVDFGPRRIARRADFVEQIDRARANASIRILLRDLHQSVLHLRMLEIPQRLQNLDANIRRWIGEQFA